MGLPVTLNHVGTVIATDTTDPAIVVPASVVNAPVPGVVLPIAGAATPFTYTAGGSVFYYHGLVN
jgi:hypothetical protein